MLDCLGLLEWTLSFLLELWEPTYRLEKREGWLEKIPSVVTADAEDEVTIIKGEMLTIVLKRPDWTIVETAAGQRGNVPTAYLTFFTTECPTEGKVSSLAGTSGRDDK